MKLFFERTVDFFSWLIDFFKNLGRRKPDDPPPPPPGVTYAQKASFPKDAVTDCNVTQGFAVGTDYCYAFRVNGPDDTAHILYQNKMGTTTVTRMYGDSSVGELGHANDMALASYKVGGVDCFFMYVVVNGGNVPRNAIVKLQYSGTNYSEVGRYYYPGGNDSYTVYSGISNMGPAKDKNGNDGIKFLLKKGDDFSTVVIPYNQGNKTILSKTDNFFVKEAFSIDRNNTFYSNYVSQGLHYEPSTEKIYVPYWDSANQNKNVVLRYNISSSPWIRDNVWEINNNNIAKFEIEGNGFPRNRKVASENNVFWFATCETTPGGKIYTDSKVKK